MKIFFKSKYTTVLVIPTIFVATILISSFFFAVRVSAKEKITITEFSLPLTDQNVGRCCSSITSGSDGNLWFTWYSGNGEDKIGKISPIGNINWFPIPTGNSYPYSITSGPDGNLWFTEWNAPGKIGRITTNGVITEFDLNDVNVYNITSGQDGNLWFARADNKIGRITPQGIVTEFLVPKANSGVFGITSGSDGNVWFTAHFFDGIRLTDQIGKITLNGMVTEYEVPDPGDGSAGVYSITSGPDGNLWFVEDYPNGKIGKITIDGIIVEYQVPTNSWLHDIVKGPDGNLWFTEEDGNKIGRITPQGEVVEFSVPTNNSNPFAITSGSDGNIWFTENVSGKIGRVNLVDVKEPPGQDRNDDLLSPFNNGVRWTVSQGYLNNRDQSSVGCRISTAPDHCRNQLFGLDMVPDQQSDTQVLAPANGKIDYKGKLEGGCMGLRIKLDNGLNMNICHFATINVDVGKHVIRGEVLGTRNTSHVHLSLDNRHGVGDLCSGSDRCYLPVPFSGKYAIEGISFDPDPNGETVTLPYPLCDKRKVVCEFKVGFGQFKDFTGVSTNVAIP